jgi:uncharacterized spore protein YtfJ
MTDEVDFDYKKDQNEGNTLAQETIKDTLAHFLATADVATVYGQPVRKGDTLIIPAAEVLSGLGFGVSQGEVNRKETKPTHWSGGGGGGRTFSRPVAVIVASPEGVRVTPIFDTTKIILAGFTALGFMFGTLMRMRSPRSNRKMGLPD